MDQYRLQGQGVNMDEAAREGMVQIPANWDVSHTLFVVFSSIICAELIQSWTTCPL
jgi:hypothetical protein